MSNTLMLHDQATKSWELHMHSAMYSETDISAYYISTQQLLLSHIPELKTAVVAKPSDTACGILTA